jgi:spore coat protein H
MNLGAHNFCRVIQPWFRQILATAAILHFVFALQSPAGAAETTSRSQKVPKPDASDAFFNDSSVRTFEFEIPLTSLAELRRSPRTYVRGGVREGGHVLTNVGIHLKGMGSFRTVDEKASFALKFDEFAQDQEYCGLTKLMFNNSVQDPTYIVEGLATELFRDAGLPASRVTHARVRLNGRDLGLYVVIEAMNKRFLKRHFQSSKGNLYEAYVRDIDPPMDQDNGEDTTQADVRALINACGIPEASRRFQRLREVLDVEQFVSFAAMEILVGHWDGYTIHTNNYRLYHEPVADKMHFITHGLDWAFRRPNISIEPPLKSMVGRAVFQTAEGRKLFQERIGVLFTNVFRVSVITNRLEQALTRLRTAGGLTPAERVRMERAAASIRERIELRGVRVAEQLAGIHPPQTRFDADNSARLTGWRDEYDRGEVIMDQPEFEQRATLHLKAGTGRSRGSWRTQVYLPRGRYRFEGMIRCSGLTGGSAGLRISGGQRNNGVSGQTDWRAFSHDFEVKEDGLDVEFVCDFYGTAGEVWFDREAFRLRRF